MVVSCQEKIDIDVPGTSPLVVIEAEITSETDSSFVKLSKTVDYYETGNYPAITAASVLVNGVVFNHMANGIYKPVSPYKGVVGQQYNLAVVVEGKTYTASSILEPMFRVDTTFQTYRQAESFLEEGYAISYVGYDDRSKIKFTYFRFGLYSNIISSDSLYEPKVLFNNDQTPIGTIYPFELPFVRYQKGQEAILIFRSITKDMNDFIEAYNNQTSGAPGPFQVPPANLPTNIVGGAIGYFATYDVVRRRHLVY